MTLLQTNTVDADQVLRVEVTLSERNAAVLSYHSPQTALEAKFSAEFAVACPLIANRAGLAELTDDFVRKSDVQALMKCVSVTPIAHDGLKGLDHGSQRGGYSAYDQVVIETRSGTRLDSGPITKIRGEPELPLRRDELWDKFEGCMQVGNREIPAKQLFDALMSLDGMSQARDLVKLMAPDHVS